MNKSMFRFLVIGFFLVAVGFSANAQIFKGMVMAGANFAQMNGDQTYGFNKIGLNAGAGVMAPLNEKRNFLMSLEVLYNELGARESKDPFKYNTKLQYVSIPVIAHFEDRRGGLTFGLGLQYSRLFQVNEDWGLPVKPIQYMDRPIFPVNDFKRDDISLILDFRFRVWERLKLNFRYQYSIVPIREDVAYNNSFAPEHMDYFTWKRDFYHNVLSLRLIYVINERSSRELDKNINRDSY